MLGRLPMPFVHIENSTDKQLNKERIIDGFIYINYSNEKWINFRRVGGTFMKKRKSEHYTLLFLAVNDIYMVISSVQFSSVQFSCVQLFATPWTAARLADTN